MNEACNMGLEITPSSWDHWFNVGECWRLSRKKIHITSSNDNCRCNEFSIPVYSYRRWSSWVLLFIIYRLWNITKIVFVFDEYHYNKVFVRNTFILHPYISRFYMMFSGILSATSLIWNDEQTLSQNFTSSSMRELSLWCPWTYITKSLWAQNSNLAKVFLSDTENND